MPGARRCFAGFSGCNLWTGREQDRASATCQFCDTDFDASARTVRSAGAALPRTPSPDTIAAPMGRRTSKPSLRRADGGEPMLQVDTAADRRAARQGFTDCGRNQRHHRTAARPRLDLRQPQGRRRPRGPQRPRIAKLVYPQCKRAAGELKPSRGLAFERFSLQPMDGPDIAQKH